MKVLIGTPIHVSKDYAMERWLKNVAGLIKVTPADIILVDNSPGLSYVEKVKKYCKRYGLSPKIVHLEINQDPGVSEKEQIHERIAKSREVIRQEVIKSDYDAWFCWENDQIIPNWGLDKLVKTMEAGDFMVVDHNCWINDKPGVVNFDYGVTLMSRECLKKYGFIPPSGNWYNAEKFYRERLRSNGGRVIEIEGLIDPVFHLAK